MNVNRRQIIAAVFLLGAVGVFWITRVPSGPAAPTRPLTVQDRFVDLFAQYRDAYKDSERNDIRQKKLKENRDELLCNIISDIPLVENWTGIITAIDQEFIGFGPEYILRVSVGTSVSFETDGGSLKNKDGVQDIPSTNIKPGSKLAGALEGLRRGTRITFSGRFVTRNGCAWEKSVTTRGSFSAPQIVFEFTTINGVSGNGETSLPNVEEHL